MISKAFILCIAILAARGYSAAQSPAGSEAVRKVGKSVLPPVPIYSPEALFPPEARRRHMNGLCLVSVIVDETGMPKNVRLIRCTDAVFAENSLNAVRQYRFKPARTSDGKAVPVMISIEVNHQMFGGHNEGVAVNYAILAPAASASSQPDSEGIYALNPEIDPPSLTKFVDEGYERTAFMSIGKGACDVTVGLDTKGKPASLEVAHCDSPLLEKPAVDSLRGSHFKPGRLNGAAVPVKVIVHLELGGYSPQ